MAVLAHPGEARQPHDLWWAWRFDPGVLIPLLISGFLYARGARVVRGVTVRQQIWFWVGLLTVVIALVSPLHPLGEVLFSAHMAQHEVLMLIAAPLLVLSRPFVAMLWGLPFAWRRTAGRWCKATTVHRMWSFITAPLVAWSIHALAVCLWHLPAAFEATLTSELVHGAQHLSFFVSALLFWWSLQWARSPEAYGAGVLYIFSTGIYTSILGALLTFSHTLWYPAYAETVQAWGLTAIEDQQIGGLIMWVPGGVVYLIGGLFLFSEWLRHAGVTAGRRYAD